MIVYPGPTLRTYTGRAEKRPVVRPPIKLTLHLMSGQTVTGVAQFVGEYDLALHDETGAYRSFPRDAIETMETQDPLEEHRRLLENYTDADMHNLLAYLGALK